LEAIVNPQGTHWHYPYVFSYVNDCEWEDYEQEIFDFLQNMQDHNEVQRAAREQAFEEGVTLHTPTMLISKQIVERFNMRQAAVSRLSSLCTDPTTNPVLLAFPKVWTASSILQAYRWKAMLVQTTLLSALNGIFFELTSARKRPHRIHKYTVARPEQGTTNPRKLILQDFIFSLQQDKTEWYLSCTSALLWERIKHLFRQRSLTSVPPSPVVDNDYDKDLTKFVFGERQVVAGKLIKYMWHFSAQDNESYIAANKSAIFKTASIDEYSTRIDSSPAVMNIVINLQNVKQKPEAVNFNWYEDLLSA